MLLGSKWKLAIPPGLGYGARPRPNIPANSALFFDVELVGIEAKTEKPAVPAAPAAGGAGQPKPAGK